ncbi:MAG TPA: hypothetical protein VKY22_28340 [Bradyrhizobium sp.]|nr:hypothetical protein [Bradyrhizobium sp.]
MKFFLYEILARIVAIYFCFDCGRTLWSGLVERRITYVLGTGDILDWFFPARSRWTFERDATPIQYWMTVGLQVISLLACIGLAIFGWFHPND